MTGRRVEDKSGIWLETSHAIFWKRMGCAIIDVFIDAAGEDIRGEDLLLADMNHRPREGAAFHLRFHLHPHVKASLQSGGDAVFAADAKRAWVAVSFGQRSYGGPEN